MISCLFTDWSTLRSSSTTRIWFLIVFYNICCCLKIQILWVYWVGAEMRSGLPRKLCLILPCKLHSKLFLSKEEHTKYVTVYARTFKFILLFLELVKARLSAVRLKKEPQHCFGMFFWVFFPIYLLSTENSLRELKTDITRK